jgi:glycine hydroxymethyltransferase
LTPEFEIYSQQVIKNAQALCQNLIDLGARIVSGGTDNHLFCIDVASSYGIGGKFAEESLEAIGISVNKNMIPFDERKPMDPSGIRIGTPALTTRGMKEEHMKELAIIIDSALRFPDKRDELKRNVENICRLFPIYLTK